MACSLATTGAVNWGVLYPLIDHSDSMAPVLLVQYRPANPKMIGPDPVRVIESPDNTENAQKCIKHGCFRWENVIKLPYY